MKSIKKMQSIYIMSTRGRARHNKYKFGRHTGTKNKLVSRYITYLTNPTIYYFEQVSNPKKIEAIIKRKLKSYRITNKNGNMSEWVRLDLEKLIRKINEIIENYSKKPTFLKNQNKTIPKNKQFRKTNQYIPKK